MSVKTLISSAVPLAHCTVSKHGPVPAPGAVIHAGVAATGLGKLCYCQSPLLLSLFLRHTTLFLVLDLSQPQELWFTLGVTATLLLSPFLRHTLLFLVLGLFRCRSCGWLLESLLHCCFYPFLRHTTLFLVLDLSQPQELWFTLESLLQTAKSRVEAVIADMKSTDPDIKQKLQKAAWERVGEENPVKCSNFIVRTISVWMQCKPCSNKHHPENHDVEVVLEEGWSLMRDSFPRICEGKGFTEEWPLKWNALSPGCSFSSGVLLYLLDCLTRMCVCACAVSVILKCTMLPPCVVGGRNSLYCYYYSTSSKKASAQQL